MHALCGFAALIDPAIANNVDPRLTVFPLYFTGLSNGTRGSMFHANTGGKRVKSGCNSTILLPRIIGAMRSWLGFYGISFHR